MKLKLMVNKSWDSTTDSKIKFDSNWSKGMPRDENRGKSIYFN